MLLENQDSLLNVGFVKDIMIQRTGRNIVDVSPVSLWYSVTKTIGAASVVRKNFSYSENCFYWGCLNLDFDFKAERLSNEGKVPYFRLVFSEPNGNEFKILRLGHVVKDVETVSNLYDLYKSQSVASSLSANVLFSDINASTREMVFNSVTGALVSDNSSIDRIHLDLSVQFLGYKLSFS